MAIDPVAVMGASAQAKQAARAVPVAETPSLSDHLDRLENALKNATVHAERMAELLDMPHQGVLAGASQSDSPQAPPTLAERQGQRVSNLEFYVHNLACSLAQMTQEAERLR